MCLNEKFHSVIKLAILLTIVSMIILCIVFRNQLAIKAHKLEHFIVKYPDEGPAVLLALYVLCEFCFIPAGAVTMGVGYTLRKAYHSTHKALETGVPLVLVGAFISASMGFALGRYICRR